MRPPGRTWLSGLACALVLLGGREARAQAPASAPSASARASHVASLERQFLKNLLRDQQAIWTSPFRLQAADLRWLAPLAGGTAVLMATDRHTGDAVAKHPNLVEPSKAISYAGSAGTLIAAAGTFYLVGRAAHDDRARETGILGGEALIDSILVVTALKIAMQRARPDAGEDRGRFWAGGTSFPSGHASESWALAVVVASEYHEKRAVQVAAYGVATLVSLSRFTAQRHYLSDVLVGSAIGFGIGRYVYHTHHLDASSQAAKWPAIMPDVDRRAGRYGVTLTWVY